MMILFEKEYDGESLYDAGRDLAEAFVEDYNPLMRKIPQDKHGFQLGTFKVVITWEEDDAYNVR